MIGIAAAISWSGDPAARDIVQRMLARVPHRGSCPSISNPAPGVFLGATVADALGNRCVSDARLDNRAECATALGAQDRPPLADPELLTRGYERWGTDLADRLVGDFALVVWDSDRQALYAARDPFGVRPLFCYGDPDHLILASEVEQIVTAGIMEPEIEDRAVLDFLGDMAGRRRETLFRGVVRVLPGHWLLAARQHRREERYWQLPRELIRLPRHRDYAQEFRHRFRAAVAARLDAPRPVVAQLSGGLDSSSIVCMANAIAGDRAAPMPRLHAVSAVFPGLACDETAWIDAVARRIRFPVHRWNAAVPRPLGSEGFAVGHPWGGTSPQALDGDLRLALDVGAAGILSGVGGDELLFERGVFRDLAAAGRWLTLLRQTVGTSSFYAGHSRLFYLGDAVRTLAPDWARRIYHGWRPRPLPPCWLGERLWSHWNDALSEREPAFPSWASSSTQWITWRWLTRPELWASVELEVLRAGRHGIDMRFPFLDRPLADFVLAVPFEHRLPGGQMKRLLREGMRGILPRRIMTRPRVTTFECRVGLDFLHNRAPIQALVTANRWDCEAYVPQVGARKLFEELDTTHPDRANYVKMGILRKIVQLELWLRNLHEMRTPFASRIHP